GRLNELHLVPRRGRFDPTPSEADTHWELARRLLEDEAIALDVRVSLLLALLYGQHLSRVLRLRRTDWTWDGGVGTLKLGDVALDVPESVATLVERIARAPRGTGRLGPARLDDDWLIPGAAAGRPRSYAQ